MIQARKSSVLLLICGLMLFVLTILAALVYPTQAAPPQMPPRPPKPTPTRSSQSSDGATFSSSSSSTSAFIHLNVRGGDAHTYTMIEWQDSRGTWHAVNGWRGTLEDGSWKRWWLPSYLFGAGPFRWLVYERAGGDLLAVSDSFDLPTLPGRGAFIQVSLNP